MRRPEESLDSDEALAGAARQGDSAALERLLIRHESTALRLLRSFGVPAADREDVAQEITEELTPRDFAPRPRLRVWRIRLSDAR